MCYNLIHIDWLIVMRILLPFTWDLNFWTNKWMFFVMCWLYIETLLYLDIVGRRPRRRSCKRLKNTSQVADLGCSWMIFIICCHSSPWFYHEFTLFHHVLIMILTLRRKSLVPPLHHVSPYFTSVLNGHGDKTIAMFDPPNIALFQV